MDNSFFEYLQKLEVLVFFSGFPLVYTVCFFFAGIEKFKNNFIAKLTRCLPFGYALVGTLYLGLQLKNLYPDYSFQHIQNNIAQPLLTAWGLLSILFWIPALAKKKFLALVHSMLFFGILLKDLLFEASASTGISNDMNVYTVSLLLNTAAVLLITLFSYLYFLARRN
jgi:hypothetical protein